MDIEIKKSKKTPMRGSDAPIGSIILDGSNSAYLRCKNPIDGCLHWVNLTRSEPCSAYDNRSLDERIVTICKATLLIEEEE